jgi:ATP-dependent RNA circularization protein (DNA/RNA ligase family)
MKKSDSNEKDAVVIAVPSVEEARVLLLSTGLFEVCPSSDNSVIDKENGFQVRLITIGSRN